MDPPCELAGARSLSKVTFLPILLGDSVKRKYSPRPMPSIEEVWRFRIFLRASRYRIAP
jgi:hypothetical protein